MGAFDGSAGIIRAFELGRRMRMERERMAQEQEDRKLERDILQQRIRQLKIDEAFGRRQAQIQAAQLMEGRRGEIVPGLPSMLVPPHQIQIGGRTITGPPNLPRPAIPEQELPHPAVNLEAIPDLGIPEQSFRPRNLSELLKEHALTQRMKAEAEPEEFASSPLGIFSKRTGKVSTPTPSDAFNPGGSEFERAFSRKHGRMPTVDDLVKFRKNAGQGQISDEINRLRADLLRMQMSGQLTGAQRLKAIVELRELAAKRASDFDDLEAFGRPIDEIMEQEAQRIYGMSVDELKGTQKTPTKTPTGARPTVPEKVVVISPQGQRGRIPINQLQEALRQGYKLAQ